MLSHKLEILYQPIRLRRIYQGDLVKFNGGYIEQAGVSNNIGGVFNGVHYQSSDGPVWNNFTQLCNYSSGDIEVYIYDTPTHCSLYKVILTQHLLKLRKLDTVVQAEALQLVYHPEN